jgi:hypothetical protein
MVQTVEKLFANVHEESNYFLYYIFLFFCSFYLYFFLILNLDHITILDRGFGSIDMANMLHNKKQSFIMSCKYNFISYFIFIYQCIL